MNAETKVGLFTVLGLALLGLSIYLLGNFTVSSGFDVKVYFKNVSGLPAKSVVRLNGVEVGKVKNLQMDGDKVLAVVRINKGIIIYKDSKFSIAASSLIGTNFLQIDQGNAPSGILKEGDFVQGISMPSITDMIAETMSSIQSLTSGITDNGKFASDLAATLSNLRMLSGNLNELISSLKPYISSSVEDVSELTKASRDLMTKIDDSQGLFGALVDDPQMKQDVQETLANVKQISEDAKTFLGKMAKFRMFWEYDVRYQPNGDLFESDLGVKIVSNNGFTYYRGGISDLGNRDNMPKNEKDYRVEPNQIDLRLGLYNDWADLSVGMIRGSGGAVLQLKPFFKANSNIIKSISFFAEGTDFGRNRIINNRLFDTPEVSVGAKFFPIKNIYIGARYDDMLAVDSLQVIGGLSFEDKELASLLGLATLAN
ncbi:MAG: MlaD family protein [Elusimicrobiota bacterium]|jgi:phospholipid/cholesterol/gamma-HCH transport system substrate-binding protein|nr:MlaD family protein [Elusimicrobiota bacterium]